MEHKIITDSLANRLDKLLKWKGMSQYKLAKELGIDRSHLSKVINSAQSPKGTPKGLSNDNIEKIAKIFDIDFNYLKTGVFENKPRQSGQTLLNTIEAFGLNEFLMTEEEIYQMREQESNLMQNYRNLICDEVDRLQNEEIRYMYHCLKAIISVEHLYYVFLNFINQLNKDGLKRLIRFMNTMNITHEECITAFPLSNKFYEAELFLGDADLPGKSDVSKEKMVDSIKESILAMDDERSEVLFKHLREILTLNKTDWQMLKRFSLLKSDQMVSSVLGYKVSVNHDVIFDYLECLIKEFPIIR